MNKLDDNMYTQTKKIKIISIVMIVIGILSCSIAFITDSHSAWTNLLFNNYFFLGVSIFAVFFVALQHVAEAGWATVLKRVPEAMMTFLPITAIIMLFIAFFIAMYA